MSEFFVINPGNIFVMTLKTSSRFLGFVCIRLGDSCSVVTSGVFLRRFWGFGWVSNCLQVAREAVLKFRPGVDIVAHHGNVKNVEFDIDFFKQFSVVLNGLDNLEARRHVNRLCLAAGVPLVESGTTGYLGQVCLHRSMTGENGVSGSEMMAIVTCSIPCCRCNVLLLKQLFSVLCR
jgi:hypothetical protein